MNELRDVQIKLSEIRGNLAAMVVTSDGVKQQKILEIMLRLHALEEQVENLAIISK